MITNNKKRSKLDHKNKRKEIKRKNVYYNVYNEGWGRMVNPKLVKKKKSNRESFSPLCEVLGANTTSGELQSP